VKVLNINEALKRLERINEEIRYASVVERPSFSAGVIAFKATKKSDAKQIRHRDKDVLCHVLKGRGRLRVNGRRITLKAGTLCHIPKGTPHDFAAAKNGDLVLFYSLIKTR